MPSCVNVAGNLMRSSAMVPVVPIRRRTFCLVSGNCVFFGRLLDTFVSDVRVLLPRRGAAYYAVSLKGVG